jgi:hypothetical protein
MDELPDHLDLAVGQSRIFVLRASGPQATSGENLSQMRDADF